MSRSNLSLPAPEAPHVWFVSLSQDDAVLDVLAGHLSSDERDRADRFQFARDRRAFTVARGALRQLLAAYTGLAPERLAFTTGPHGKPSLEAPGPAFNLSHAGSWAVVAVAAAGRIGVDLEAIRPLEDLAGMARQVFSPDECEALAARPAGARLEAFFRLWTYKEAVIKAVGAGFSMPTTTFSVLPGERWARLDRPVDGQANFRLLAVPTEPGYMAAVAAEPPVERLLCRRWTP